MNKFNNVLSHIWLYILVKFVVFFGLLGFEMFRFSERIANFQFNYFFYKISKIKTENLVQHPYLVKGVINSRFKHKITDNFADSLSQIYVNRVCGLRKVSNNDIVDSWKKQHENKKLNVRDYFLLSKYFSKLGRFVVAYEIDKDLELYLNLIKFDTIYSLFQKIKYILHVDSLNLEIYLSKLGLTSHFYNNYKINSLITKLKHSNIEKNSTMYILGPLRDLSALNILQNKIIAIIKPHENELKQLNKFIYEKCYLYTAIPINEDYKFTSPTVNISDQYSKTTKHSNKIDYYSQFLLINGYPQHMQRVLIHQLFETDINFFYIDYFTFFLSDNHYSENIFSRPFMSLCDKTPSEIHELIWSKGWHDLISNFRFVKFLLENNLLETSKSVHEILSLSIGEYVVRMENKYKFSEVNG